jgi:hypothetical protein
MPTLDEVIAYATAEGRICPTPPEWGEVYRIVLTSALKAGHTSPRPPLFLAAWWHTSDGEKQERFHSHLRLAHRYGVLNDVNTYLISLTVEQWRCTESPWR